MNGYGPPFRKRPGSAQRASNSIYRSDAGGTVFNKKSRRLRSSSGIHGRILLGGSTGPTFRDSVGAGPASGTERAPSPCTGSSSAGGHARAWACDVAGSFNPGSITLTLAEAANNGDVVGSTLGKTTACAFGASALL